MFVGRLTICSGICKFYKLFWPVKGKKPRNISAKTIFEGTIGFPLKPQNLAVYIHKEKKPKIFPANIFGYDIFFSNEYFCLLSLCCTSTFVLWLWFFFQNYLNCLHAILFLKWTLYKSKLFVSWLSWIFIVFCRLYKIWLHKMPCIIYTSFCVFQKFFLCM